MITAFAVLREGLELVLSNSGHCPAHTAAGYDLEFDYVITGAVAGPTQLNDWLLVQSLVEHIGSKRAKVAIWEMSRLPPGPHRPDSTSFQWLQRTLLPIDTRYFRCSKNWT